MSNLGFREHAETAVRRISQSLFASEEENKNALNALTDIRVAHNAADVAEQTAAIDEILDAVMARESGRTQLRREERKSIEESVDHVTGSGEARGGLSAGRCRPATGWWFGVSHRAVSVQSVRG